MTSKAANESAVVLTLPEKIEIRGIEEVDFEKCARLYREYAEAPYFETWAPEESLRRVVRIANERELCFVASCSGAIVGFICCKTFPWHDGDRMYVADLVVRKDFQGKGIGSQLEAHAEGAARRQGIKFMYLHSEENSPAHQFYLTRRGYRPVPYVVLEKRLDDWTP